MHPTKHLEPGPTRLPWYSHYSQLLRERDETPNYLRFAAQFVIGYGSGPVCSSREVGASCVTAPAPAGRPPAPPHYSRNAYGPQDLRPVEWYAQPWYSSPREVLP